MADARFLRMISHLLEWLILLLVAASVVAIGSVNSWAYIPIWWSSALVLALAGFRTVLVARLRYSLGSQRFAFHTSGRWLLLEDEPAYGIPTWGFDLARPLIPHSPLLLPGILLIGWVGIQLVALPPALATALNVTQPLGGVTPDEAWRPMSVSILDTRRGLAFLLTMAAFHVAGGIVFDQREARTRFLVRLRFLGLALSLGALIQLSTGTHKVWGLYAPRESDGNYLIFGPFVDRDHYAAYMLILTPLALGSVVGQIKEVSRRVGRGANARRMVVTVLQHSGTSLAYAALPSLAMLGSLIATTSRGALAAFAGGLLLASQRLVRRSRVSALGAALVLSGLAVAWFGFDRLADRFSQSGEDAPGRTLVWRDSLQRMEGRWITGFGFNTFGATISRTTAWALPIGATPWMDPYETSIAAVARAGYRTITPGPELTYYREAHNDYLQLLTEVGAVGLALALWGIFGLVRRMWRDPWLLAAVVGPLLHASVDFAFQVPAVAVLFAVVSSLRPSPSRAQNLPK